jgi:hypothetical protein
MSLDKKIPRKNKNSNIVSVTEDKDVMQALGQLSKSAKNPVFKAVVNNVIEERENKSKKYHNDDDNNQNYQNYQNNQNNQQARQNYKTNTPNPKAEVKTYTQNLTEEEISKKLEDYKKVDDIATVPLNTHLRYFITGQDGEPVFRMGGNLKRNLDLPKFVVLRNAVGVEWTVQVKGTTFYKKMELNDIKNEYEEVIETLHNKIRELKKQIADMEKDNKDSKKNRNK